MNIAAALETAANALEASGVPEPRMQAASLLSHVIGCDRTYLIAHPERELAEPEISMYRRLVERRARREPLQYITGVQEFFGLEFEVGPAVLIPRPETEILVEAAVGFLRRLDAPVFCEIGTGSGCITVATLIQVKNAAAVAADVSSDALEVATHNAEKHGVEGRTEFYLSDVFTSIPDRTFDAILSNPPYVPDRDLATLQAEVRDHEPRAALSGGPDGLSVIDRIIEGAPRRLRSGGLLMIEVGFDQAARVSEKLDPAFWEAVEFLPDLQGIPRILSAIKRSKN